MARKQKLYENKWKFNDVEFEQEDVDKYFGFVYCITDLKTGMKYIGKKHLYSMRKAKGSTRRSKSISEWQHYYSSNDTIKSLAKTEPGRFKREILYLCNTLGETNYMEIREQFKRDVLSDPTYYNDNINGKYYKQNVMKYGIL